MSTKLCVGITTAAGAAHSITLADHLILKQVLTGRKVKPWVPAVVSCRSGMGLDARLKNLIRGAEPVC